MLFWHRVTFLSWHLDWHLERCLLAGMVRDLFAMLVWHLDWDLLTVGDWHFDWVGGAMVVWNLRQRFVIRSCEHATSAATMTLQHLDWSCNN